MIITIITDGVPYIYENAETLLVASDKTLSIDCKSDVSVQEWLITEGCGNDD